MDKEGQELNGVRCTVQRTPLDKPKECSLRYPVAREDEEAEEEEALDEAEEEAGHAAEEGFHVVVPVANNDCLPDGCRSYLGWKTSWRKDARFQRNIYF